MKHLFRRLVCLSLALTMSGCIFFTTALGAETGEFVPTPAQGESAPAEASPTPGATAAGEAQIPESPAAAVGTPVPSASPAPETSPAPDATLAPEATATPGPTVTPAAEESAAPTETPQPSATPETMASALSEAPVPDYPHVAEDPFPAPHMGGMLINGYHTYCVDPNLVWPSGGSAYGDGGELPVEAEVKARLLRALEAGYPQDALGLSALQPELSARELGTYTQWVIWNILNPGHYDLGDAVYFQALQHYALTGESEAGRVDGVTVSAAAASTLRYDPESGLFRGELSFTANKAALITLGALPAGLTVTLRSNSAVLSEGSTFFSGDTLLLTAQSPSVTGLFGTLSFSYVTYQALSGDIQLFVPQNSGQQRMLGYRLDPVADALSVDFTIDPTTPKPTATPTPVPTATPTPKPTATPTPDPTATPTPKPTATPTPDPTATPTPDPTATPTPDPTATPTPVPTATPTPVPTATPTPTVSPTATPTATPTVTPTATPTTSPAPTPTPSASATPTPAPAPAPTPAPTPSARPTVPIEDDRPPLAPLPPKGKSTARRSLYTILDDSVPLGALPKTSGNRGGTAAAVGALLLLGGIAGAAVPPRAPRKARWIFHGGD